MDAIYVDVGFHHYPHNQDQRIFFVFFNPQSVKVYFLTFQMPILIVDEKFKFIFSFG